VIYQIVLNRRLQTFFYFFQLEASNGEGRTTAAGAGRIGVLEMEAGELKGLDVVDGRAIQILVTHGIDIHLQAITLND